MKSKITLVLILITTGFVGYHFSPSFFKVDTGVELVKNASEQKKGAITPPVKDDNSQANTHLLKTNIELTAISLKPSLSSKKVKLNIQLHGAFPSKDKRSGYALISYNNAPQQVYVIGSSLSEGVLLKSLSATEVVIDNHGTLEKVQKEKKIVDTKSSTEVIGNHDTLEKAQQEKERIDKKSSYVSTIPHPTPAFHPPPRPPIDHSLSEAPPPSMLPSETINTSISYDSKGNPQPAIDNTPTDHPHDFTAPPAN